MSKMHKNVKEVYVEMPLLESILDSKKSRDKSRDVSPMLSKSLDSKISGEVVQFNLD